MAVCEGSETQMLLVEMSGPKNLKLVGGMRNQQKGWRQKGGVMGRALLALTIGAGAIALLTIEATRHAEMRRLKDRTNALAADVERAQLQAEAALAAVIAPDTLADAKRSVYLIVVNGAARGTAFVIDRENGILATAAHTADSLPLNDAGAAVEILNRASAHRLNVRSTQLHAGYGAFRELVEEHQPIRNNSPIYAPNAAALRDLAFDAALLTVDPIDAETGENLLGPDLAIAAEETLLMLNAGAPIAVIGYPFDTLDDGFAPDAATPRVERGVVSAMTPPLDTAQETRDPVVANLIIHRLSTAGGNSGSPILNQAGEVVGIHTHGVVSPSSNADGAAQRADVIFDLLSKERESDRLHNVFFPAWRRTLSFWARAEDALSWSFYMEYAQPNLSPAPRVADVALAGPYPFDRNIDRLSFNPEISSYRVSADDLAPAGNLTESGDASQNTSGDKAITRQGAGFVIRNKGEYAELWRSIDRSKDSVLFAFDYSLRSRRGFCPLSGYWRKKGETKLRVLRARASFELYLPAAGDFTEDYQIILRRDSRCDPISAEFFFGDIAWNIDDPGNTPTDGVEAQTVAFSTVTGRHSAHSQDWRTQPPEGMRAQLAYFMQCRLPRGDRPETCEKPVYIELETSAGAPVHADQ